MELNRDQIIKALEEELKYVLGLQHRLECNGDDTPGLDGNIALLSGAIRLIKEITQAHEMLSESYDHLEKTKDELLAERSRLTMENERLNKYLDDHFPKCIYQYDGDVQEYCVLAPCGQFKTVAEFQKQIEADTVRKMHSEIKDRCIKGGIYPAFVARTIDEITKEMLDGIE